MTELTILTAEKTKELYEELPTAAQDFISEAFDGVQPYQQGIADSVYEYAANQADGLNNSQIISWLDTDSDSFYWMESVIKEGLVITDRSYGFYNHVQTAIQRQTEDETFEVLKDVLRWYACAAIAEAYPAISEGAADAIDAHDFAALETFDDVKSDAENIIQVWDEE